jgi:hypothetical protein
LPIYQKFFGKNFFISQEVRNFVPANETKHLKIDKMETSRKVGEIHKNGKWAWTWDARPGGKIYRAFWNTMNVVLKGSGNTYAPKGFVLSEREFNNKQS